MQYLFDTNIVSDLVHEPQGRISLRVEHVGSSNVCTSIIVASELRFGARKRGSQRLTRIVDGVLQRLHIVALEPPVDHYYAECRAELERQGIPVSGNDLLIASQALALDLVLVTDNVREFSRIEGLTVENWLRD